MLHKQWVCQHSRRNKVLQSERACDCAAAIDILIKKNNRNTQRNDEYLKRSPPLCATVTANFNHNHTINSIGSLKYLRLSAEVKTKFFQYFDEGLSPAEAMRAHENSLMVLDNSTEAMANGSLNPISRTVYYIHGMWKKAHFGDVTEPFQKLKEKIPQYAAKGNFIFITVLNYHIFCTNMHCDQN